MMAENLRFRIKKNSHTPGKKNKKIKINFQAISEHPHGCSQTSSRLFTKKLSHTQKNDG